MSTEHILPPALTWNVHSFKEKPKREETWRLRKGRGDVKELQEGEEERWGGDESEDQENCDDDYDQDVDDQLPGGREGQEGTLNDRISSNPPSD